jgi:glycosyltransferase involved in cell wall biosynthesis
MKILVVSPYPIVPPLHGSRVRTARLAEALGRAGATVTVLCPWYPGQPRHGRIAGAFTCYSHLLPANLLPLTLEWLAAPLALLSFQPPPRRRLRSFADYDVVQFEFCAHADWLGAIPPGAKIVYSAHNVERDFCHYDAGHYLLPGPSLARIEHLERLLVRRSDLVVTCTPDDAARLQELYGSVQRALVVPNGCPIELLEWDRRPLRATSRAAFGLTPSDQVILFVGGNASHNREAVTFLLSDVLPHLDATARLLIAGKCARPSRSADARVRFLGFVDDLRPCFAAADIAANPVERGSGSSAKLLEYLAAGLPVVSTAIGVRGFQDPPPGVRIASRAQFAATLGDLPMAAPDRAALGQLTWEALGRGLLHQYEGMWGVGSKT